MVVYRVLRDGMEDEVGRRKTEEPFIKKEGSAEVAISKRRAVPLAGGSHRSARLAASSPPADHRQSRES